METTTFCLVYQDVATSDTAVAETAIIQAVKTQLPSLCAIVECEIEFGAYQLRETGLAFILPVLSSVLSSIIMPSSFQFIQRVLSLEAVTIQLRILQVLSIACALT